MSVTYTATLSVREQTVLFLASLLNAERARRGTRAGTRALGCFKQAVLVLRWFLDGTRMSQLARDNGISRSTGYDYLHEGIDVLAARTQPARGAAGGEGGRVRSREHRRDAGGALVQQQLNTVHNSVRAVGERGNSLLKMTFKALRNVSLDPWRIGKMVAAALVLLHFNHARTT